MAPRRHLHTPSAFLLASLHAPGPCRQPRCRVTAPSQPVDMAMQLTFRPQLSAASLRSTRARVAAPLVAAPPCSRLHRQQQAASRRHSSSISAVLDLQGADQWKAEVLQVGQRGMGAGWVAGGGARRWRTGAALSGSACVGVQ